MLNDVDASAVYLFYTNRPNYHQYTLLQVATGTQIPAAKSKVSNSSHYYHYLHTSLLTGSFPLSQDVQTLYKQKLLLGIESTRGGLIICAFWKSPERPSGLRPSALFNNHFQCINYQQVVIIGQLLFHRPKSQQRRLTLVSVNRKMASRKRKETGGWEKLKQKKAMSLEEDASKCRKLTELFGSSATASSSSNVDVSQSILSENQVDIQPDYHMLMVVMMRGRQLREFHWRRRSSCLDFGFAV